jgi:hypothetical protein
LDHPKVQLFESRFPAVFEVPQPLPIVGGVSHIVDDLDKIVAIKNAAMALVSFNLLRLITRSAKMIDDFEDSICNPIRGTSLPSLNWRGRSTSNRRQVLLIGGFAFDCERNVLIGESFERRLGYQVLARAEDAS